MSAHRAADIMRIYIYWYNMDEKKKQKFTVSQRWKIGGTLHTKRKCQGNQYIKLANTDGMTLSNEQVDHCLFTSHKRIRSLSNNNPTDINNNLPSPVAAATSNTEISEKATTVNTFISDSSFWL